MATITAGRRAVLDVLFSALAAWLVPRAAKARRVIGLITRLSLTLCGLGLITAAAWTVALPLGLLTAGVCCLLLEWVVKR